MTTTQERVRDWQGPAILSFGFRPFFLAASLWAAVAMALWVAMMAGADPLPQAFDPVAWHAHEFLFGYLGAVIAGFLLTAVPNWTGRLPVVGWSLGCLAGLWLIGRAAIATSALWPPIGVALADLALHVALVAFLAREIIVGRNWKNLIVLALILTFLTGNALFHLDAIEGRSPADAVGLRTGLAASILLVAVIGGRVVPSFTRNWLVKRGTERHPAPPMQIFDKLALLVLLAALTLWVLQPEGQLTGAALMLAGLMHFVRLSRWMPLATLQEPLVWILHVAYFFIPLGAVAVGASLFADDAFLAGTSMHVWTIGAIGTMTLAVMTRATLGHTGAALHAGRATCALYLALPASLVFRLIASHAEEPQLFYTLSSLFWIAAFLGFAILYGPRLLLRQR